MPKEIETKFNIRSPGDVRKALKKMGARFVSRQTEKDVYYAAPSGFRGTIRLRSIGKKSIFTVKSPCDTGSSGPYKIGEETEAGIQDAALFGKMFKVIGFTERYLKEKIRENYVWKGVKISIDTLPHIGTYMEIEAPKSEIRKAARALGLEMKKAIPDTYMELFGYYKLMHKKPNLEFIFGKKLR